MNPSPSSAAPLSLKDGIERAYTEIKAPFGGDTMVEAPVEPVVPTTDIDGNELTSYQVAILRALLQRPMAQSKKVAARKQSSPTRNERLIAARKARRSKAPSQFMRFYVARMWDRERVAGETAAFEAQQAEAAAVAAETA